jgi:hypothetical protein
MILGYDSAAKRLRALEVKTAGAVRDAFAFFAVQAILSCKLPRAKISFNDFSD